MDLLFLVIEHHGSFVACLLVGIFDDCCRPLVGLAQDGLLHLFDPLLNASDNH